MAQYDASNYKDLDRLCAMREQAKIALNLTCIDALEAIDLRLTLKTLDIAIAEMRGQERIGGGKLRPKQAATG